MRPTVFLWTLGAVAVPHATLFLVPALAGGSPATGLATAFLPGYLVAILAGLVLQGSPPGRPTPSWRRLGIGALLTFFGGIQTWPRFGAYLGPHTMISEGWVFLFAGASMLLEGAHLLCGPEGGRGAPGRSTRLLLALVGVLAAPPFLLLLGTLHPKGGVIMLQTPADGPTWMALLAMTILATHQATPPVSTPSP